MAGVFLLIWPHFVQAQSAQALIAAAHKRHLSESPYWHTLLHCPADQSPYESLVDDPDFFLSKKGKYDAKAELEALITTFYGTPAKSESPCRFIARLTWLHQELGDLMQSPPPFCPEADALSPSSATLVFPTYHLNNPASMFGHSFLTIETDFQSPVLADAVNYAALPDGNSPFAYMFKGIFGLFPGYYTILPYYKKIQEYGDMAQRDIWEYPLTLTPEETRRMTLHILEMRNISSDYFFFDENCSYMLQFLLESARPGLKLTAAKGFTVIPIDTIRQMKQKGLITDARYRPSVGSRIQAAVKRLPAEDLQRAKQVVTGQLSPRTLNHTPLSKPRKREILDLAVEVIRYKYAKKKMTRQQYRKRFLPALRARQSLGMAPPKKQTHQPPEPSTGHKASRITLSAGVQEKNAFGELTLAPAFTDLLGADHTDREGVAIEFFETTLRYAEKEKNVVIQQFTLLDLLSLSPRHLFIKPLSWSAHIGYDQMLMKDGIHKGAFTIKAATGMAWSLNLPATPLVYLLPEARFTESKHLEKGAAVGTGLKSGCLIFHTPALKTHFEANLWRLFPEATTRSTLTLETSLALTPNNRVSLQARYDTSDHSHAWQSGLSFHRYF
ncbi:MAG: DUF4105 domain-containing protein [Desulfobacterales bacterium]|nr:DUF4105 domain-containing protein [Desulfobacterales bacterium]